MKWIYDKKINAYNCSFEMTIEEYYNLVKDCLDDNEYQRKRVRNSGSIYNLLKQDIIKGCVMPPIVLALSQTVVNQEGNLLQSLNDYKSEIKILDGLQRSYTIKEIVSETENSLFGSKDHLQNLIRVELYSGINKLGILYRMLTLNAGQTQMTTRHQIEIIYSEYKKNCDIPGVSLFTETDGYVPRNLGEYKFRDVIEGFTSFVQKDYLTLDRKEILDNVRDLERLSRVATSQTLFYDFVDTYHHFVYKMNCLYGRIFDNDDLENIARLTGTPFANSIVSLFNKSQTLTGYGCAIADIMDRNLITDVKDLHEYIENIWLSDFDLVFIDLMIKLDFIRRNAKKIGNDQRKFFFNFFVSFFTKGDDSFLNFEKSVNHAFEEIKRNSNENSLF